MTEAATKVELRPETLLAHATHIAAADAAVEQALRGDQPFLRWDGCAERNAQLGRARSSRNSVPSVRPQTQALEPLQGDRSSAGEGRHRGVLRISARLASARERHSHTLQGERHDFLATMAAIPREVLITTCRISRFTYGCRNQR